VSFAGFKRVRLEVLMTIFMARVCRPRSFGTFGNHPPLIWFRVQASSNGQCVNRGAEIPD
jgi:hypothetical protein